MSNVDVEALKSHGGLSPQTKHGDSVVLRDKVLISRNISAAEPFFRITENGNRRITENGFSRILETA